jgi:glycerate dehydrogenase
MKIVVLDGHGLNPGDMRWDLIAQFGEFTVYDRTPTTADTIARIGDAQIILTNKTPITEEILNACPSIQLICVLATGYNIIDCAAAAKRGIPVCNVPGYSTEAVAQFTFALLLEICHQVGAHSMAVHRGDWTNCPDFCFWYTRQRELAGKTLGIIGFGSIGRAVGRIAKAMGMHVIAHSRTEYDEGRAIAEYVSLDELLSRSDIISLHCPLFPETANLINHDTIARMKDGVLLINTARGGLIDEDAVASALATGRIAGYAADVVSKEPIEATNPLLSAPNCILTPHMAWAPNEARQRIMERTAESIQGFLSGKPVNTVNM